ncbi:MAG: hypothetical protein AB1643_03190 [Patescibacteria group bacterium]
MRYLIPLIFLTTAIVISYYWSKPIYDDIRVMLDQENGLNNALTKSKELQIIRDDLLARYNSISKSDLEAIEKMIPNNPNNVKIAVEIENIARKNNVVLKTLSVQGMTTPDSSSAPAQGLSVATMDMSFKASAPYNSFLNFLADLEKSLRIIEIKNLTFNAGETDFYEYNFSALTYYSYGQ